MSENAKSAQRQRLAAALRANLKRRKAAARGKDDAPEAATSADAARGPGPDDGTKRD